MRFDALLGSVAPGSGGQPRGFALAAGTGWPLPLSIFGPARLNTRPCDGTEAYPAFCGPKAVQRSAVRAGGDPSILPGVPPGCCMPDFRRWAACAIVAALIGWSIGGGAAATVVAGCSARRGQGGERAAVRGAHPSPARDADRAADEFPAQASSRWRQLSLRGPPRGRPGRSASRRWETVCMAASARRSAPDGVHCCCCSPSAS
jgi:hypothetical protein